MEKNDRVKDRGTRDGPQRIRTLTDAIKEAIVVLDVDGNVTFWNKGAERMLGYSEEEVLGKNAIELMAPGGHKTEYRNRLASLRETGKSLVPEAIMEFSGVRKDGTEFPIEITASPVKTEGKPHVVVVIRDVTEKKDTERALLESEVRYRLIEKYLTDVILITDLDLKITYVSPFVKHQTGYTAEEVISKPLSDFVTPESLEQAFERKTKELAKAAETATDPPIPVELVVEQRRKDGTTFWSDIRVGFLRRPDGTPYAILGVSRDITQRKLAEEALKKSEERYRLVADNLTDVIWTTDLEFNWTYISPSVEKQTGFTIEEVRERDLATIMTPESLERVTSMFQEGFEAEGGDPLDRTWLADVEVYKKHGGTIWVELRATFLRDSEGKATGILGIARDVTEQRHAEEKIQHRLTTEKTLARISDRLINPTDLGTAISESLADLGKLMDVGRAYLFEATDDLQYVSNTYEWVAEGVSEQRSNMQNLPVSLFGDWVDRLKQNQVVLFNDIATVDKPSRDILELQEIQALVIVPMFGRMKPFGFLGLDEVKGPRKWKEEDTRILRIAAEMLMKAIEQDLAGRALRESEARIRGITEATNDGILIITASGEIIFANPAIAEMTGYSTAELVGGSIVRLLPEAVRDDHIRAISRFSSLDDIPVADGVVESVGLRKNGATFPIEVSLSTVQISGNKNVLAMIRDITERKRIVETEKEAAAAVAAAEVSKINAEELRDIIVVSAHELRHPATIFKGYSQILLENWDDLDEKNIKDALERIDASSTRLADLAANLLDTSYIEQEKTKLNYSEVSPASLILGAVEGIGSKESAKKLNIRPFTKEYKIQVDPEKISKVLGILIDNALKYSLDDCLIDIWCDQTEGETVYHVLDRGPGIPDGDREKIFQRFYEVEEVKHHSLPGMGLGLYIAKSIVESHGGWIQVSPAKEGGSLFSFGIPRTKQE